MLCISLSFIFVWISLVVHFYHLYNHFICYIYSILKLALVRYNGACPKNAVKLNNKILLESSKKEERRILSFISISYHTRRIFFMLCNKRSSFEGQCVNEKSFNIWFDLNMLFSIQWKARAQLSGASII